MQVLSNAIRLSLTIQLHIYWSFNALFPHTSAAVDGKQTVASDDHLIN